MFDALSPQLLMELIDRYAVPAVGAVIVLIVGWMLSKFLSTAIANAMARSEHVDETLRIFFRSIVRYLLLAITVIAVLEMFGIEATGLVAVLGAASLAIGLALQGTLQDVAAGVMLLIFRPFRVGDFIEAGGQSGTVKAIGLFTTEMATGDNVQIIAPNGSLWGSAVKNYSFHQTRRVDLTFGISYEDDIGKAMQVIRDVAENDPRAQKDPAVFVAVTNLGDSSVDLTTRIWCNAGDYWGLRFELLRQVKQALDAAEISIPYPHMEVVLPASAQAGD